MDIFAARGTPAVATEDGRVTQIVSNAISGLAVEIQDGSGIQYFYAHLSAFARGLHTGQRVKQGQVLGFVGNTGNAAGSAYHIHFEIQPGGLAMPPKPIVDRWLLVAERRAEVLVSKGRGALADQKDQEVALSVIGLLGETVAAGLTDAPIDARTTSSRSSFPVAPVGGAAAILLIAVLLGVLRFKHKRPPARAASRHGQDPEEAPAALLARMVLDLESPEWPPDLSEDIPAVAAGPLEAEPAASSTRLSRMSAASLGLLAVMMLALRPRRTSRGPR